MSGLLASLQTAIAGLAEALSAPETDLHRDAAIQRFESCFELAWKAVQQSLREQGLDCRSPRACFKAAWSQGWIELEEPWLAMLEDRNRTTHTYHEPLAREVFGRLHEYLPALQQLARELERLGKE